MAASPRRSLPSGVGGGVLEHPEASHAWRVHGLNAPAKSGEWFPAGDWRGWTCCVEQGHYGHRARKATWLYVCGVRGSDLPELKWGSSGKRERLDEGFRSTEEARAARSAPDWRARERLSARQRKVTPLPFRDVLIAIARSARPAQEARTA